MNVNPGTFYYIEWPHTDTGSTAGEAFATKHRPAIAITTPDAQGDVTLLKVTGSPNYPRSVAFTQDDLATGLLKKNSYIRTDRFLTVHYCQLHEWGASLSAEKFKECYRQIALSGTRQFSRLAHASNRPGWERDGLLSPCSSAVADEVNRCSVSVDGNDETPTTNNQRPTTSTWSPGQTIPYAGRVFTEDEVEAAVSATLDFWLTLGPEGEAFEKELAAFLGVKSSLLVNSGSSANLVAISALTTHKLPDHKRIKPGDEVITVAAGFPTTVAPIIQVGAVPVFIDALPQTGNADCSQLEAAYQPGKTKAVMMAHALGNPFEMVTVLEFCKKHDLWLIEDNCDALGCTYALPLALAEKLGLQHLLKLAEANGSWLSVADGWLSTNNEQVTTNNFPQLPAVIDGNLIAYTGSFGDLSTQSFYPPHHLTMGEGGAVNIIRKPALKTYAESFRDWGRDCWCPSGKDDTCTKRFQWQLGELPEGYDHKYIYSHLGYNLKPLDPQAAIGRVQLRRLPEFIEARKRNWEHLRRGLNGLEEFIEFALPTHATAWIQPKESEQKSEIRIQKTDDAQAISETASSSSTLRPSTFRPLDSSFSWDDSGCQTDCSWFGFMMTIKKSAPFTRTELAQELDKHRIGNRMLFGGNLLRQPALVQIRNDRPDAYRIVIPTGIGSCSHSIGGGAGTGPRSTNNPKPATNLLLPGADRIMNRTLFLGTYPGLTAGQIEYIANVIREFVENSRTAKPTDDLT